MFINFPVQCSACELCELFMAKLREKWIASGDWMKNIIQSNFVHDEGIWECPESEVNRFTSDIREVMENVVQFRVPMRADILVVNEWGSAKSA
jgi:DNA polymerase-1